MTDYFDRVQDELRAAAVRQEAAEQERAAERPPRRFGRMSRPLLVTLAALIVAVPAAAAVVVFQPDDEPDGLVRTAPKGQIAAGDDPVFGRWEAFASASTAGPCFGIRLVDPPGTQPGSTSEGCGTTDQPARIGGGDGPPATGVYGFAPAAAVRVRLEADGHAAREFPTHATTDPRGDFFFASLAENPDKLPGLRVIALAADGRPISRAAP